MSAKTIAFAPRRKGGDAPIVINTDTIRYIQMKRNYAEVHLTNGAVFTSRITMEELEQHLGEDFIKVEKFNSQMQQLFTFIFVHFITPQ